MRTWHKLLVIIVALSVYEYFVFIGKRQEAANPSAQDSGQSAFQSVKGRAVKGDVRSQYVLGYMYDKGRFAEKDDVLAAYWYEQSAMQGYAQAQYLLAYMLFTGRGKNKDIVKAAKWYEKSAEQGLPKAQNELAILFLRGQGVKRDYIESYKWFSVARERGYNVKDKFFQQLRAKMNPSEIQKADMQAELWFKEFTSR